MAPGSLQCGPDAGTSREEAPPRPTGEWIKTWGAIAGYAQRDEVWSTTGKFSEEDARQEVLGKCNASGATDCTVDMTYFNQCVASSSISRCRQYGRSSFGDCHRAYRHSLHTEDRGIGRPIVHLHYRKTSKRRICFFHDSTQFSNFERDSV
ncbi:DUF4189 domain-containing protein [Pseudomonas cichorii]|nr:DUF4189 domain-containing protein [Pseudomonas cichorii]MBX8559689.1 DUF4189 domain-containing protein [Pseudomonas cichorii]MBX8565464.1 DUF4189 domain-containing protein [Pseudomonas cichorii]MBX8579864.1 DUF4189 domain-containing protein [Pseudomonas cichorii]